MRRREFRIRAAEHLQSNNLVSFPLCPKGYVTERPAVGRHVWLEGSALLQHLLCPGISRADSASLVPLWAVGLVLVVGLLAYFVGAQGLVNGAGAVTYLCFCQGSGDDR